MAAPSVEHIELSGGVVTASFTHNASGRHARPEEIGKPRFFVEVVDPVNSRPPARICLWDSSDYGEAISMAEKTRKALGIAVPVHDTVAGAAT